MSYSTAQRRTEEETTTKMKLVTRHFGELEFDESIVYHFPNGLFGFEELHDFIIIDDKDTEPLRWLLSVEDPTVGFAVVDATHLAPELYGELAADERNSSSMFVVLVLRRDPEPITANLKAPIVLNNGNKFGKQLVLNSDKYLTDYKIN